MLPSQVTRERTAEEAAADIASLLGGEAPDVCIECSGAEPSVRSVPGNIPNIVFLSKKKAKEDITEDR